MVFQDEETAAQNGQNARQLQAESHDDRAFDTMLRLLIMMEGELQTKEAVIEMLMVGRDETLLCVVSILPVSVSLRQLIWGGTTARRVNTFKVKLNRITFVPRTSNDEMITCKEMKI